MRTNKNTTKIIIALLVAFLATMISYSAFSNMNKQLVEQKDIISSMQSNKDNNTQVTYAYAIAKKPLKAGEVVSDEDVDFVQVTEMNNNAFDNRSDVINKILLQDIETGNMFTNAHIAKISSDNVTLKEGYRALTLPTDNFQGKSKKMVVGSNVDIYNVSKENPWDMENIRIISFENSKALSSGNSEDITTAGSVTFEVSANDIADFISNASKSKLVLVARNPNDKRTSPRPSCNANNSGDFSSVSNLPANVPISDFPEGGLSGLPQPFQPQAQSQSVELIEANVKSKVTFD